MDGSVLEEKSSFKMLRLTFLFKLYWGSYKVSTAETVSNKIGALICSIGFFFFPEVAPCPICHLDVLDRPQIQLCGTVGPSLAAFLEPLSHHPNVASISILLVLVWWIFK